jgi:hypothetical protein
MTGYFTLANSALKKTACARLFVRFERGLKLTTTLLRYNVNGYSLYIIEYIYRTTHKSRNVLFQCK